LRNSFFIVLYGVSGAGKSTLRDEAIKSLPKLKKLIAVTTRPPRQGEIEGVDKYFLTEDEFFDRNSNGELCLANKVYEHMYAFRLNDFKSGDVYICELYHRDYNAFRETGAINVNIYIKPYFLQKAANPCG
jgi:guanylate kinase